MATEVPEASGPPAIPELEPEAVQPVTETLRDESAVSSLEDEKIRLIAMLSAFDGAGIEGLPGQFEKVKEAMLQAGIPSSHIDTVRKAMEKKDYKESVYQLSRAFNVAERAKKKEIVTDESREHASGVVFDKQDVPAPEAKPPKPDEYEEEFSPQTTSAFTAGTLGARQTAFNEFKRELGHKNAFKQLADDSLTDYDIYAPDDKTKIGEIDKWEAWNKSVRETLEKAGMDPDAIQTLLKGFDLKTVKPITKSRLLEYTGKALFGPSFLQTGSSTRPKTRRTTSKASPRQVGKVSREEDVLANFRNLVHSKLYTSESGKWRRKILRSRETKGRAQRRQVFQEDAEEVQQQLDLMDAFLDPRKPKTKEDVVTFIDSLVGSQRH